MWGGGEGVFCLPLADEVLQEAEGRRELTSMVWWVAANSLHRAPTRREDNAKSLRRTERPCRCREVAVSMGPKPIETVLSLSLGKVGELSRFALDALMPFTYAVLSFL